MRLQELGRTIGEAWRALSIESKMPYTVRAENERKRYDDELCAIGREVMVAEDQNVSPPLQVVCCSTKTCGLLSLV